MDSAYNCTELFNVAVKWTLIKLLIVIIIIENINRDNGSHITKKNSIQFILSERIDNVICTH